MGTRYVVYTQCCKLKVIKLQVDDRTFNMITFDFKRSPPSILTFYVKTVIIVVRTLHVWGGPEQKLDGDGVR